MECHPEQVRNSLCRVEEETMRRLHCGGSLEKLNMTEEDDSRHLNFNNNGEENDLKTGGHRSKTPRDPLSHRIIEKRRRDRMNNCLADLSRLIPPSYMKQGQGRIEKTEIIEMAISLINTLTEKVDKLDKDPSPSMSAKGPNSCCMSQLSLGFHECKDEVMRFLVEGEGMCASDSFCEKIMAHLKSAGSKLMVSASERHQEDKPELKLTINPGTVPGFNPQMSPAQPLLTDQQLRQHLSKGHILDCKPSQSSSESSGSQLTHASLALPYSRADCHYSTNSSDGTFTDFIRPDCEMGSTCSGQGAIYKFKHNITKRFSLEKNGSNPSDTSSSSGSSREDAGKLQRRKMTRVKGRSQGSRMSPYPSSSDLSSGNTSNGTSSYQGDVSGVRSDSSNSPPDSGLNIQSTNIPLPGFVLHPAGTHYFPISIHPNVIPECFRQNTSISQGMGLFHPISIPVQFCGPYISMGDRSGDGGSVQSVSSGDSFQLPLTYKKQSCGKSQGLVL